MEKIEEPFNQEQNPYAPPRHNSVPILEENVARRQRHGFTTFWLVGSLIFGFISAIFCLFVSQFMSELLDASIWYVLASGIILVLGIIADILMLRWKKSGFFIFIGINILQPILSTIMMEFDIFTIIFSLVAIVIRWGVLNIRKNGKTVWEQLE